MTGEIRTERTLYSGNVQGVGFRWTTKRIAAGHSVTGFVQNLADGSVELVVQSPQGEIDRFRTEILEQLKYRIEQHSTQTMSSEEELTTFEIRC